MTGPRILVADDDDDIRELVCVILRVFDFDPIPVGRGDDALTATRIAEPDLAILDVDMPGLTGTDVCRAVRAQTDRPRLPILLMSALCDEQAVAEGLRSGADGFVAKPFTPKQLMGQVERMLAARSVENGAA